MLSGLLFAACGGEHDHDHAGHDHASHGEGEGGGMDEEAESWTTQGEILEISESRTELSIRHEDIPGYMPAMTMPFYVDDAAVVEGLAVGDRIELTFDRPEGARHVIRSARKL